MSARRAAAAQDLARAGGADAPVELVPYDAAWPQRFARFRHEREAYAEAKTPFVRAAEDRALGDR